MQVNPEAFRGRGVLQIFMEEGTTLYRGWGWTMARNAPGSFAVGLLLRRLSQRLPIFAHSSFSALRRCGGHQGLCPRRHGLLKSYMDTKLHCFRGRRSRLNHCCGPARYRENSDTKR